LKGNIRVFCRVRPVLPSDLDSSPEEHALEANLSFPDQRDHKEIVVLSSSESATGQERKEVYNFGFDRVSVLHLLPRNPLAHVNQVFEPQATQAEVFEEISQLAQSCTDGYNVCIFAYGQTGSGKSFTMEGGAVCAFLSSTRLLN
jgi:kinesin family member C1